MNEVIKCPSCSVDVTTVKIIDSEGKYLNIFVKTEPTFFYDYATGESSIGNQYCTHELQMYYCTKCNRKFGLVVDTTMIDKDNNHNN